MHTHNGNTITPNAPFTIDGKQYPANWLQLASPDDLIAAGIIYTPDPTQTLDEAKVLRVAYLASEKERVENLAVTFNGHPFAAGSAARKDIDRLLLAQANGAYVATTLYDDNGAAVTFTALTLKALHTAFANTAANAYANYWAKHALVQAATTIPAVEAIVW